MIRSILISKDLEEYSKIFSGFLRNDILQQDVLDLMEYDEEEDNKIEELFINCAYDFKGLGKPL